VTAEHVIGVDVGTESSRAGVFALDGTALAFASTTHELEFPRPNWVEQHPEEWWRSATSAVRQAVERSGVAANDVAAIAVSCTGTTVVASDRQGRPIRSSLMWMDVRAAEQAERIAASGHDVLRLSAGTACAEWFFSKTLWLAEREPQTYREAEVLSEGVDWLGYRLTGAWAANLSLATVRGYYRRNEGGWPVELLEALGHSDVLEKVPPQVLGVGEVLGGLTSAAAADLGLPAGIPVAVSAADAEVGVVGLDALEPGQTTLITGSSHLLLGQSAAPVHGPGMFGSYEGGVLPGQYLVEGGQASTGSITRWLKNLANGSHFLAPLDDDEVYGRLVAEASALPAGAEGVRVLDFWQGNRTPYVDPQARGMIWGLSLAHGPAHLFRGILEGIAFGTENILRAFADTGYQPTELVVAGGATKNPLWLQIHADVSQISLVIPQVTDAVCRGNAILAATAAGRFPDIKAGARTMSRSALRVEPDPAAGEAYQPLFDRYRRSFEAMRALMHEEAAAVG